MGEDLSPGTVKGPLVVSICALCGLNDKIVVANPILSVCVHSPVSARQIRIVRSSEAEAISFESSEKATDFTPW